MARRTRCTNIIWPAAYSLRKNMKMYHSDFAHQLTISGMNVTQFLTSVQRTHDARDL